MTARMSIKIKKGDSYNSKPIRWMRGTVGVDLTNLTGKCQVRSAANSGIVAELTVNKLDINGEDGWFNIDLTSIISKTIPTTGNSPFDTTLYYYEVEWSGAGGYVETILAGDFNVEAEVSQ